MFEIMSGRGRFWQWDTGQTVLVTPYVDEVHWSIGSEPALVVRVREDEGLWYAEVPNILLQSSGKLTAWACAVDGDGRQYVRASRVYEVQPRPKPEDYIYTETEVLSYANLDRRLTELEGSGIGGLYPATETRLGGVKIGNGIDVEEDGTISIDPDTLPSAPGGLPGEDGFSPIVDVQEIEGGHRVSITDKEGVKDFDVMDGAPGRDGLDGAPGAAGADGVTPHIGENGNWWTAETDTGQPSRGAAGKDGAPGIFPTVTVPYAAEFEIKPNTMTNIAPLEGAITLTLGDGLDGYENEWAFTITQGETARTITMPTAEWTLGIAPTFAAGTTTEVRLYYLGDTLRGVWNA